MKRLIHLSTSPIVNTIFILYVILMLNATETNAQEKQSVTGKLIDVKNSQAIPYASVALIKASDSAPVCGTLSDEKGVFTYQSGSNRQLQAIHIGNWL